ncbi:MAG: hypothetical protein PHQ27_09530 [Victivallales bacterium]|nr:hypothetical protein [Victivallales bacterium]
MKKMYLIVNTILLIAAGLLVAGHLDFRPSPPDKALRQTPMPILPQEETVLPAPPPSSPPPESIQQRNIFDPARGQPREEEDQATVRHKLPDMELIGICRLGTTLGAIIAPKNYHRPGMGGQASRKRYFKINEEVLNGYVLNAIETNRVILQRGQEHLELHIGRKRSAAIAATAKPPAVPPQKAAPPGPGVNAAPGSRAGVPPPNFRPLPITGHQQRRPSRAMP